MMVDRGTYAYTVFSRVFFFFASDVLWKKIILLWGRKIIFLRISYLQIKSLAISGLVKDKNKSFSTVLNTTLGHKGEHICRVSFVCPVCAHLALQ